MEILPCKDENEWVDTINEWIVSNIKNQGVRRIFLPAGDTPRPLYENWESQGAPFGPSIQLMQLDEVLAEQGRRPFRDFFKQTLPSFQKQFLYIDEADSCADLALLGLGLNGHMAFHEPGLGDDFFSGCLNLNVETCRRLKIPDGSRAVSYGLAAFLKTKSIALIVRGEAKREILKEVLREGCDLPAAKLKGHGRLSIVTDFSV